ncbi:hypothetical protein GUITHDRAFT_122648 [Guillardia theta CCMP2712]|uniref:Uncharacterized protein n=3 Tax=Guillardia theta TaxID=55529 RepID=L1I4X0_GUITC|nr:hypothetical protein GUITHDRAFT_122648 [Guillardia theta CCMP2712]EKX31147.1 hypothetical protein GUITHDRAFT_122648 [Guillardia theta CCMP2712]|eukprot:XP_005818127.1 hypothetical protein GUITHDRAFT_122648 [Guillardia theta CCMP2712]
MPAERRSGMRNKRMEARGFFGSKLSLRRAPSPDCRVQGEIAEEFEAKCGREDTSGRQDTSECPEELPKGCVMGIPVPKAQPVMQVAIDSRGMEIALMRSVQSNNFPFVCHMILSGWTPNVVNPTLCHFSVTVHRTTWNQRDCLHVKNACLLHYAICCGSLQAATALLVAFPHLATLPCTVSGLHGSEEEEWSMLELAQFFCDLYKDQKDDLYSAYKMAHMVLTCMHSDPSVLPFINNATPRERLVAGGGEATAMIGALCEAACKTCTAMEE